MRIFRKFEKPVLNKMLCVLFTIWPIFCLYQNLVKVLLARKKGFTQNTLSVNQTSEEYPSEKISNT